MTRNIVSRSAYLAALFVACAGPARALTAIEVVRSATGDPTAVAFDRTHAYLGHDHRATEFCDPARPRLLIQKVHLSTGAATTLLQGRNLCQAAASWLSPDRTHVFYLRGSGGTSSIRAVNIVVPGADELVVDENATSLFVNGTNLYWTASNRIRQRAKSGGAIRTLFTAPAGATVALLGLDRSFLFFDEGHGSGNTQSHWIRRVPLAGGPVATLHTLSTGRYITGFDSDARNVYWTETPWGNALGGSVRRVSKSGTGYHTIHSIPGASRAHKITVTASRIYWVQTAGFDLRDPSVIRSRTNPAGSSGSFTNETASRGGIGAFGSLRTNAATMFWYEYNWASARQIVRGRL